MDNRIKIKNCEWSVIESEVNSNVLDGNLGMCVYRQNEIHIAMDIPIDNRIETFYHELSHALLAESGFNVILKDLLGDKYEIFVDNFGNVIQNIDWDKVRKIGEDLGSK